MSGHTVDEELPESFVDYEEIDGDEESGVNRNQAVVGEGAAGSSSSTDWFISQDCIQNLSSMYSSEKKELTNIEDKLKQLRNNQLSLITKIQSQTGQFAQVEGYPRIVEVMGKLPSYTNKLVAIKKSMNNMRGRIVKLRKRTLRLQESLGIAPELENDVDGDDEDESACRASKDGNSREDVDYSPGGIVVVNPDPRTAESKTKYSSRHR